MAQELLPGEQLLWSGGPSRTALRPADVAESVFAVTAVAWFAAFELWSLHGEPTVFWAFPLLILAFFAAGAVRALVQLALLPGQRRQTAYQVTDYRIVVTMGLHARHSWSAFLDQVPEPIVRPAHGGTADVVLSSPGGGPTVLRPLLNGLSEAGPFSALGRANVPVLESLPDAAAVRQVIADARERVVGTLAAAPVLAGSQPGPVSSAVRAPAPPPAAAGLALEPGEQVWWTGGPEWAPWWFGPEDLGVSAFGLACLTSMALIGWLSAITGSAPFLIILAPMALAGGVYPAIGRVLHRRARIRRSQYFVTDRRVAVTWQLGGQSVTVQQPLRLLLPPEVRWRSVITGLAPPERRPRSGGWRNLPWPASTIGMSALVGLADPDAVRQAIAAGQLAARRPAPPDD